MGARCRRCTRSSTRADSPCSMRSAVVADASASPASITLVVPAFNEQATLDTAVRHQHECLRALGAPFEILIVDDGSTDATAVIAQRLTRELPDVRLIGLVGNQGVGAAIWS